MSTCEICWSKAYLEARMLGGHQVDHYERLVRFAPHEAHVPTTTPPTTRPDEESQR